MFEHVLDLSYFIKGRWFNGRIKLMTGKTLRKHSLHDKLNEPPKMIL